MHFRNKLTIKSNKAVNIKKVVDLNKLIADYLSKEKFISIELRLIK